MSRTLLRPGDIANPGLQLFAMNQRGLSVLHAIVGQLSPHIIAAVIGARDTNVRDDFYDEIRAFSVQHGIMFLDRMEASRIPRPPATYAFAVGWRWIIHGWRKLIVFHDSLLPRYRGFSPLPAALINGDEEVGVTALFATSDYDCGRVIEQKRLRIRYPVKIQDVIESLTPLYVELAIGIARAILTGSTLPSYPQDPAQASYAPWRDEDDYRIDWSRDAAAIRRFIDAVGYPYEGASTKLDGVIVRVLDASVEEDVKIEQRVPGKVMFVRDQMPIVTCGTGMLKLRDVRDDMGNTLLPLRKFRSRLW